MEEELEEQMRRVETLEISGRNSSKKGIFYFILFIIFPQ